MLIRYRDGDDRPKIPQLHAQLSELDPALRKTGDSHLRLVFRHQLGCIPSLDRLQLRGIEQAYLAQTCRSGLCREERKIGPEQDLCRCHQFGERRQRVDGHGIGRIVVEPFHIVGGASRKPWLQILTCGEVESEPLHQERRRAAGVRKNPVDIGELLRRAAEQ